MKNKLDNKNIELTKILYDLKQSLDLYKLIALNADKINKKSGKAFGATSGQQGHYRGRTCSTLGCAWYGNLDLFSGPGGQSYRGAYYEGHDGSEKCLLGS